MKTREERISEGVVECLNMLYKYSVPSMSFDDLQKQVEEKKEYDKEYYAHHYLPQKLYDEILERFRSAYGLDPHWKPYCDVISDYLFKGGRTDIYVKDENGIGHRDTEPTKPLSEIIGEDNAEKVQELFDKCRQYYRFDYKTDSFNFSVGNYGPTSYKKTVEDYWKSQGKEYSYDDEEIKKRYYREEYGDYDDEEATCESC